MTKKRIHNITQSGFKTPDNYFDNLESNLLSELNLKSKIDTSGFNMPDGYLENFSVSISKEEKEITKVIPLFNKNTWLSISSIAAVITLLFTLNFSNKEAVTFSSLDNETIESYLLLSDVESAEISTLITDPTVLENAIMEETVSDSALENYLYDDTDIEDYILE